MPVPRKAEVKKKSFYCQCKALAAVTFCIEKMMMVPFNLVLDKSGVPRDINTNNRTKGVPRQLAAENLEDDSVGIVIDMDEEDVLRDGPVCSPQIVGLSIGMCVGIGILLAIIVPLAKYICDQLL